MKGGSMFVQDRKDTLENKHLLIRTKERGEQRDNREQLSLKGEAKVNITKRVGPGSKKKKTNPSFFKGGGHEREKTRGKMDKSIRKKS